VKCPDCESELSRRWKGYWCDCLECSVIYVRARGGARVTRAAVGLASGVEICEGG